MLSNAAPLALALVAASFSPPDEAAWRERLFPQPISFDELALVRFTPEDLERSEREEPAERVRALSARMEAGEADPRLRLELASALATVERREEAHALFAELGAELERRIEAEEGNWELAGLYGEVLAAYGDAFHSLRTLEQGEGLLRRALDAEPASWNVAEALCALHLRQGIALRAAGDARAANRALELARSYGARAVEAAPEEFRAHRTRFLARWAWVGAEGTLESALDVIGNLRMAAELAPEPEWTAAMADLLESSLLLGAVEPALRPEEAYEALPEALRARPTGLDAGLQRVAEHAELGEVAQRLSWLLAFYGAQADERARFDRALGAARSPALLIEARLGLLAWRAWLGDAGALLGHEDAPLASVDDLERNLVELRPDARTQDLLASVDLARGALDDALDHCRRSLELDPEGVRARVALAVALLRQGAAPGGPRSLLEPLVASEGPPLAAVFALGTALALDGERERALELLELAFERAPLEQRAAVGATLAEVRAQ